jgi:DNA-binding CsgD family transcriptional regulator
MASLQRPKTFLSSTGQCITAGSLMMCCVEAGMGAGPVGFGVEQQDLLWAMWRRGESIREMERTLGETLPRIRRFLGQSGGIPPVPRRRRANHLTLIEREEISRGIAAGLAARSIADRLGRPSSTVSREIARNGGRHAYRALAADAAAFDRARRPKVSKLAGNAELAGLVAAKLDDDWSPQQIAQWLRREHSGYLARDRSAGSWMLRRTATLTRETLVWTVAASHRRWTIDSVVISSRSAACGCGGVYSFT